MTAESPAIAANAPPTSAPITPVEVAPLPPVRDAGPSAAPAVAPPAAAPVVVVPPEEAWWQQPQVYALIALVSTLVGFGATMLYMRKPDPGMLRVAVSMTGASAVFILAALAAWLF